MEKIDFQEQAGVEWWLLDRLKPDSPEYRLVEKLGYNFGQAAAIIGESLHYWQFDKQVKAVIVSGGEDKESNARNTYLWRVSSFYNSMREYHSRAAHDALSAEFRQQYGYQGYIAPEFHRLLAEVENTVRKDDLPIPEFVFECEEIDEFLFSGELQRNSFIAEHNKRADSLNQLLKLGRTEFSEGLPGYYEYPLIKIADTCRIVALTAELSKFVTKN